MKQFRHLRWALVFGVLFGLLIPAIAFAAPMNEQQKIDELIHSIEVLPGAQFIRNGSAYNGHAAAEHLQTKRHYAGSRIKTADQFITYCATKSSMSDKPYQIRFSNGKTEDSAIYFRDELKRIEAQPATAAIKK